MKENVQVTRSKEWIYNALMYLLKKNAFRKVSIEDITKKAGVARPTFYRNFESKEDILIDQGRKIYERLMTDLESGIDAGDATYDSIKKMITFRKYNLVYGNYSMFRNPIDIIFCRNVMIYFDKVVQTQINMHLTSLLQAGGLLFIGHSESIPPTVRNLKTVRSSIYMKQ